MCIEVNDEDEEDDEDETAYLSAHEFGCQMIDHFARVWPSKKIWLPCMEYVQRLCTSSRALDRRAALDVLTVFIRVFVFSPFFLISLFSLSFPFSFLFFLLFRVTDNLLFVL